MNRLWVVSYDIEDDKIRRQVHTILKDHGERAQYSVFECWLDSKQLTRLRQKLRDTVDESDSIRWYPLCKWCSRSIEWQGQGNSAKDADFHLL